MPSPHDSVRASNEEMVMVERAQSGDVGAFESLYRATAGRVYALCLRMSGDREHARALTHDVYVRVWEKLHSFRGESAFTTWLHRVTVNVVLEEARGDARRRARVSLAGDAHDDALNASDDDDFPESVSSARVPVPNAREGDNLDARIDLERAIEQLPPNARRVFVMHDVQGYKHEDIASAMEIAEGTVRAHLHRARALLMERLKR